MNLSHKTYYLHLFFISLLAINYLLPLFFVGQVTIHTHDNLDGGVVFDHIISKIYKGDFESINYFLSGEIKWYYIEEIFYPINILHYFLDNKLFYFTDEILKKIFAYFAFYLLAKSIGNTKFNSALGAVLYSSIINMTIPLGIGLCFLPYILYLLIKKNSLNRRHFVFLFLIGLNSSLIQDALVFVFLIPLSFLFLRKKINLIIYLQVMITIFLSSILSNMHLIIGTMISEPIHRSAWIAGNDIIFPIVKSFQNFFTYSNPKDPTFIFNAPLALLTFTIFFISFFLKNKRIRNISLFIIFILIAISLLHHSIIDHILIGFLEIFKGYNFQRLRNITPFIFLLLFVLIITRLNNKKIKNTIYVLSFIAIISLQLRTPLPIIGETFLRTNMSANKFDESKKNFLEKKYINLTKSIFDRKNYNHKKIQVSNLTRKTFDGYYMFEDYSFIKNIVKKSRVMSVGLDPMVAVMNDIRVIDGYHSVYPLSYKTKFRKIIKKELENNIHLKNYYDNWGSRVYAFYSDKDDIKLDFQSAKSLGASYIISKFPINNVELEIICSNCNNSSQIFLYRIL